MPSSIRQLTSTATKGIRDLRTALAGRRCDHLLIVKHVAELVAWSETLQDDVAHLDPALADDVRRQARAAIASLGTLELRGEAPGMEQMTDPVGRLICERQLPTVFLCHLIVAALEGAEQGLRSILIGTAATAVKSPLPTKKGRTPRRSVLDEATQTQVDTPVAMRTEVPVSDRVVDLLNRHSPAPATVSAPSSGRVEIKPDTERI